MKVFRRYGIGLFSLQGTMLSLVLVLSCLFISCDSQDKTPDSKHFFAELRFIDGLLQGVNPDPAVISGRLERLEKGINSSEYHLALLKRRRHLAELSPYYKEQYLSFLHKLRELFPYSEKIAVITLSELLTSEPMFSGDNTELEELLSLITDEQFLPLLILAHVRLGSFDSVQIAASNTTALGLLENALSLDSLPSGSDAAYTMNASLLRILQGDRIGAFTVLDRYITKLQTTESQIPDDLYYLGALLHFDFGDLSKAALYAEKVSSPAAAILFADIQYKRSLYEEAQSVWLALSRNLTVPESQRADILYNLAASSSSEEEKKQYLTILLEQWPAHIPALIAYARILDDAPAISFLQSSKSYENPLVRLELIKRSAPGWGIDRSIGELWMLINQYPQEEALYAWTAFYMNLTGRHKETELLLEYAERYEVDTEWSLQYKAFYAIQNGDLDQAESVLRSAVSEVVSWQTPANLAVLMEARRAPASAIELYQLADSVCKDAISRSEIQLRIANNFYAMNRDADAVRSLEYALDLNSANMQARAALRRILR